MCAVHGPHHEVNGVGARSTDERLQRRVRRGAALKRRCNALEHRVFVVLAEQRAAQVQLSQNAADAPQIDGARVVFVGA